MAFSTGVCGAKGAGRRAGGGLTIKEGVFRAATHCWGGLVRFILSGGTCAFTSLFVRLLFIVADSGGRAASVGGLRGGQIVGVRMSPCWCTEYSRGTVSSSGATGCSFCDGETGFAGLK